MNDPSGFPTRNVPHVVAPRRKSIVNGVARRSAHAPDVALRLLGHFELRVAGVASPPPATVKARSLLAYLAGRAGERIRRETVMSEFWPDADPTSARNNFKTALSSIRKAFRDAGVDPSGVLEAGREVVRWIAGVAIDAVEFERSSVDVPAERARALALYQGELLPGDYAPWASELRDRLAARYEDMLRAELAERPSPALANRILLLDPYCGDAYLLLIEDALRAGNRREAQFVYHRYAAALADLGAAPSSELAVRVGAREQTPPVAALGFVGRASELAEIAAWLADEAAAPALIVSGLAGIGKSALLAHARGALHGFAAALASGRRGVHEARPETLAAVRAAHPDARELVLGPLRPDEVALALARCFPADDARRLGESVWPRAQGHPLLVQAEIQRLADARGGHSPLAPHFPRAVERRFEEQLQAAGDDAERVAELLALEPQLDGDDLVALLDWSSERVGDARERLIAFGILADAPPIRLSFGLFGEVALRRLTPARRHQTIARIAERLALHEHPSAKVRVAEHLVTLGRPREAAQSYADAGRAYVAFAGWSSALDAFDAGIAVLEPLATSAAATALLRELYLARGTAQYHAGQFQAAVHSLDGALELSEPETDAAARAGALVTMGNALISLNHLDAAHAVARQAAAEAQRGGALASELEAHSLTARLRFIEGASEDAFACATPAYARARDAGEWTVASALAQSAADAARRGLRFADCYVWVGLQLEAAVLAGPVLEAQAHYAIGSVDYAVNRLDAAVERVREALRIIAGVRRRRALGSVPLGHFEWHARLALAHTLSASGKLEAALVESERVVHSPWARNTPINAIMTFSTLVDIRLASGRSEDVAVALAMESRFPMLPEDHRGAFLDRLARARLAALVQPAGVAAMALRRTFALIERAEPRFPDQIHIAYEKLAPAARGIDEGLAERAAEAGRRHRRRVVEAAGALWCETPAQKIFGLTAIN